MALIYAHRGFSALYPENTMLAFRKAAMAGADGIELDVHLSKDGEVMIIHDEKLGRTCGLDGVVSDYTRTELEKINAGKTKDERFGFTPIPSLDEYLEFAKEEGIVTNIELKTAPVSYPDIEEKVLALVEGLHCCSMPASLCIWGICWPGRVFHTSILRWIYSQMTLHGICT